MSSRHGQELGQWANPGFDWWFTFVQPIRSQFACWPNSWPWLQLISFHPRAQPTSPPPSYPPRGEIITIKPYNPLQKLNLRRAEKRRIKTCCSCLKSQTFLKNQRWLKIWIVIKNPFCIRRQKWIKKKQQYKGHSAKVWRRNRVEKGNLGRGRRNRWRKKLDQGKDFLRKTEFWSSHSNCKIVLDFEFLLNR